LKLVDLLPAFALVVLILLIIFGLLYEYLSRIIVKGFGSRKSI